MIDGEGTTNEDLRAQMIFLQGIPVVDNTAPWIVIQLCGDIWRKGKAM